MSRMQRAAATTIQNAYRVRFSKMKSDKRRVSLVKLQSVVRMGLAKKNRMTALEAAMMFQASFLMHRQRRAYLKQRDAALTIQRCVRNFLMVVVCRRRALLEAIAVKKQQDAQATTLRSSLSTNSLTSLTSLTTASTLSTLSTLSSSMSSKIKSKGTKDEGDCAGTGTGTASSSTTDGGAGNVIQWHRFLFWILVLFLLASSMKKGGDKRGADLVPLGQAPGMKATSTSTSSTATGGSPPHINIKPRMMLENVRNQLAQANMSAQQKNKKIPPPQQQQQQPQKKQQQQQQQPQKKQQQQQQPQKKQQQQQQPQKKQQQQQQPPKKQQQQPQKQQKPQQQQQQNRQRRPPQQKQQQQASQKQKVKTASSTDAPAVASLLPKPFRSESVESFLQRRSSKQQISSV